MEFAVDFGGFRACFRESTSYGFQHTMSELTREQIEELIERSKNDRAIIVGSEVRQLANMALRSPAPLSATAAMTETVEAVKFEMHGRFDELPEWFKEIWNRRIEYTLAAAPAPAEPVDVIVLQERIKTLDVVNTAWFNELEEIKRVVGYVPAECKQTLTRYIKGIVEKATSPVWPRVWGVGRMYDNEKAVLVALDRKPTDDELRAIDDYLKGAQ
jgi:hypothetical protein